MIDVQKGVKTGRKVLQVGVTKELKKHILPREVKFGKESIWIPVQVVREGELKLCCDSVEAGAYLRVTHGEMWSFGTLGAREESVGERTRILSCAHVLTDFDTEYVGAQIHVAQREENCEMNTLY